MPATARPFVAPASILLVLVALASALTAADEDVLVLGPAQTAGIDGRHWDQTYPGALTVDAVHRSVLMRFPGAAEQIAAKLRGGSRVNKAALILDLGEVELGGSPGYNMMVSTDIWKANPPRWHVVAWALRQPWEAAATRGPTCDRSRPPSQESRSRRKQRGSSAIPFLRYSSAPERVPVNHEPDQ